MVYVKHNQPKQVQYSYIRANIYQIKDLMSLFSAEMWQIPASSVKHYPYL